MWRTNTLRTLANGGLWHPCRVRPSHSNSAIDDSGYSPAQWVLGRGLRLPYTLLGQTGRLSLHERVKKDTEHSLTHQEQCLPDHERMVQTQLDSFSRSETLCTSGEATERQSASALHTDTAPATIIGLQQESLWLAHRNNDSEVQQGSLSTRNSIRTVATWSDA